MNIVTHKPVAALMNRLKDFVKLSDTDRYFFSNRYILILALPSHPSVISRHVLRTMHDMRLHQARDVKHSAIIIT